MPDAGFRFPDSEFLRAAAAACMTCLRIPRSTAARYGSTPAPNRKAGSFFCPATGLFSMSFQKTSHRFCVILQKRNATASGTPATKVLTLPRSLQNWL